ncbi:MAG: hypothetical protein IT281_02800 [Ignavibacteria bacterium]|nr:hypothetical protein [Ignavibacteria bacterium]MCC7158448.1 hypothetical protein [Ignavibacteria bacterium]
MKNAEKNKVTIRNFKITDFQFYWVFEGNGEFKEMHNELDYRRFIERNYESKSNQGL